MMKVCATMFLQTLHNYETTNAEARVAESDS